MVCTYHLTIFTLSSCWLALKSLVVIPAWQKRRFDQLHFANGCTLTNESEQSHDRAWHHWRWGHWAEARLGQGVHALPCCTLPSLPSPPLAVANSLPWGLVIYPIQAAWSLKGWSDLNQWHCTVTKHLYIGRKNVIILLYWIIPSLRLVIISSDWSSWSSCPLIGHLAFSLVIMPSDCSK